MCHLSEFKTVLFSRPQLLARWLDSLPDLLHDGNDSVMISITTTILELVELQREFLHPSCYLTLLQLASDRICAIYMAILHQARAEKRRFSQDGPEILQLERDLIIIEQKFAKHFPRSENEVDYDNYFRTLGMVMRLLSSDLGGDIFDETLDYFERLVVSNCSVGCNLVLMLKTVIKIRFDCRSRREDTGSLGATASLQSIFFSRSASSASGGGTNIAGFRAQGTGGGPFDPHMHMPTDSEMDSRVVKAFTRVNDLRALAESEDVRESHDGGTIISGDRNRVMKRGLECVRLIFPVTPEQIAQHGRQPLTSLLTVPSSIQDDQRQSRSASSLRDPRSMGEGLNSLRVASCHTSTLFSVNSTRLPHVFLEFYIDARLLYRSRTVKEDLQPDWGGEDIVLATRGAGARELEIRLVVKNYILSDQLLGVVRIPLISQDLVQSEEAYPIDCSVDEASGAALEEAVSKTGLLPPIFYVTLIKEYGETKGPAGGPASPGGSQG
jgi:hypothetical protein